jgi:hypothetical protein
VTLKIRGFGFVHNFVSSYSLSPLRLLLQTVSVEQGKALAKSLGFEFFETSAKDNINVDISFETLTRLIRKRLVPETEKDDGEDTVKPGEPGGSSGQSGRSCCHR